jgi:hypothetical protein
LPVPFRQRLTEYEVAVRLASLTLWLDLPFYDLEDVRESARLVDGPVMKVDHPPARRTVRSGVEILAIEVGEEHFGIALVRFDQFLSASRRECEAHPEHIRTYE